VTRLQRALAAGACGILPLLLAVPGARAAGTQPFPTLAAGFTQALYGIGPSLFGGVVFTPAGDPVVDLCGTSSDLIRFDRTRTVTVHGSAVHPSTGLTSGAGCGLATGANGSAYSNTEDGVTELDPDTGAVLAGPAGPPGNGNGIAEDPQTGRLFYVGEDGTLYSIDPALTGPAQPLPSAGAGPLQGDFIDGLAAEPNGDYLFAAVRAEDGTDTDRISVLTRAGALVRQVDLPTGSGPDGIAFHQLPSYLVVNTNDGRVLRYDFPNGYAAAPSGPTTVAAGGFRGDLVGAGPDGCLYVTQNGARFDDGTEEDANSLVQLCVPGDDPTRGGGFGPRVLPATGFSCTDAAGRPLAPGAHVALGDMVRCVTGDGRTRWYGDHFRPLPDQGPLTVFTATVPGPGAVLAQVTGTGAAQALPLVVDPGAPPMVPEASYAVLLPLAGLACAGVTLSRRRRRPR